VACFFAAAALVWAIKVQIELTVAALRTADCI
jgi:hypothetical protein